LNGSFFLQHDVTPRHTTLPPPPPKKDEKCDADNIHKPLYYIMKEAHSAFEYNMGVQHCMYTMEKKIQICLITVM
jgi:hypothetical protein